MPHLCTQPCFDESNKASVSPTEANFRALTVFPVTIGHQYFLGKVSMTTSVKVSRSIPRIPVLVPPKIEGGNTYGRDMISSCCERSYANKFSPAESSEGTGVKCGRLLPIRSFIAFESRDIRSQECPLSPLNSS